MEQNEQFSFVEAEEKCLEYWNTEKIFEKSLQKNRKKKPYIFYDGPPFATGLPHHGHLLASTLKDIIPRYFTMRGFYVERRFGWDCHGLPVEQEIDKKLDMNALDAVKKLGIKGYNDECRGIIQRYTKEWRKTISRLGRWVDFDNDYKTMDVNFMESVWWVVKELWKKNLIYQGTKVVPFSTAFGTVLSNFEASDNYKQVQDPAITVLFKLSEGNGYLAAWTTTPWTLPSNLGLCVGASIDYVKVYDETRKIDIILSKNRLEFYDKDKKMKIKEEFKGDYLAGKTYHPLFDYFKKYRSQGAFAVFQDDFVSDKDGTGIVHLAPAFGVDDNRIMKKAGVKILVCPVDSQGKFTKDVGDFRGEYVKDADKNIIRALKDKKALLRQDTHAHSYPFCPRSDTPLIYKAIPSWYVNVEKFKDKLVKANQQIHWVPNHIKNGRFGKWLENARDWAISRNRIWGTPIPLWQNDQTKKVICIGSREELQQYTNTKVEDLHRENIDSLQFSVEGEKGIYRRIPEVLDCWFESGAMPYAQLHYPFENKDVFKQGFPAQFIAEGLDQTRGWFYTLTVLSTALFNKPAFKNVIVNGMVLAEDGKKMSKRLKNYTAPDVLFNTYGADALRLYLITSGLVRAEEQRFSDNGIKDIVRRTLLPWYNAFKFLQTYAEVDGWTPKQKKESDNIMDCWILSELQTLKAKIVDKMDKYELFHVVPSLLQFIEDLTNWYIRFNRSRFWRDGLEEDKKAAYTTLYTAIKELSITMP
ncbi:MAG: isoleucine--tRNA ligase, partial [Halobacteriovoraceae bacterium]|nr:isoleucine--tRNA ligase [Halobacteriovoraceae bacterium]